MKKGFTLIELLVVVLIIGILAAIAIPLYTKSVEKSRLSEADIMLSSIVSAYSRCLLANPAGSCMWDDLDISFPFPEADDGLARQAKFFWYSLETRGDSIYACRGDYNQAEDWDYCLYYNYEGNTPARSLKRICEGRSDKGKDLCAALGGHSVGGGNYSY